MLRRRLLDAYLNERLVGGVLCSLQKDAFTITNVSIPLGPRERHSRAHERHLSIQSVLSRRVLPQPQCHRTDSNDPITTNKLGCTTGANRGAEWRAPKDEDRGEGVTVSPAANAFFDIVISPNSRLCSVWITPDFSSLPWSYHRSLNMTRKSWKWKSPLWFIPHFKGQTVSMWKVGLHVCPFWTAYFLVWTAYFGWTARLNYLYCGLLL